MYGENASPTAAPPPPVLWPLPRTLFVYLKFQVEFYIFRNEFFNYSGINFVFPFSRFVVLSLAHSLCPLWAFGPPIPIGRRKSDETRENKTIRKAKDFERNEKWPLVIRFPFEWPNVREWSGKMRFGSQRRLSRRCLETSNVRRCACCRMENPAELMVASIRNNSRELNVAPFRPA